MKKSNIFILLWLLTVSFISKNDIGASGNNRRAFHLSDTLRLVAAGIDTIALNNAAMPFYGKSLHKNAIAELSKGNSTTAISGDYEYYSPRSKETYRIYFGYAGAYYETIDFRNVEYVIIGIFDIEYNSEKLFVVVEEFHLPDSIVAKRLLSAIMSKEPPPYVLGFMESFVRYGNRIYCTRVYADRYGDFPKLFSGLYEDLNKSWYPPW